MAIWIVRLISFVWPKKQARMPLNFKIFVHLKLFLIMAINLLESSSMELLTTTYPETKGYGFGLWISYPRYNKVVPKVAQRFGRIGGINTLVSHFIDYDITVVVLANSDKVDVSRFQDLVGEVLLKSGFYPNR